MFWSKPKSDPFERERLLYLTRIADLESELSRLRIDAAEERAAATARYSSLLDKLLAIGYPRLSNNQPPRIPNSISRTPLTPGYRPDLRPPDPPESEMTEHLGENNSPAPAPPPSDDPYAIIAARIASANSEN